jgi:hypothetical protein
MLVVAHGTDSGRAAKGRSGGGFRYFLSFNTQFDFWNFLEMDFIFWKFVGD